MPGRPLAIWILAAVAVLAGLTSLAVLLQFLDVIPAAGDTVEFFGGKWAGVVLYGIETIVLFAVAFGWLFYKPWAPIFTVLFAMFGFFVPLMSYFAGTSLFSTAAAPMIFSAVILLLSTRPQVRQALAEAAAYRSAPKPAKAAAAAPVKNPNGFRADEV